MSIRAEIKERIGSLCREERLFHLPPEITGMATARHVFVSKEVYADVQPPWPTHRDGYRLSMFRALLDAFTTGEMISVAEDPFDKPNYTILARVHPVEDECWDLRVIDPNPGIRCLGSFAGLDTFIALTWNYRENICGNDDWGSEIERCKAAWKSLFDPFPPFRSTSLDQYLSENFYAV